MDERERLKKREPSGTAGEKNHDTGSYNHGLFPHHMSEYPNTKICVVLAMFNSRGSKRKINKAN